ncbi:hypothetical protein GRI69_10000 [Erythrobacter vulgaris]|uniref:Oligosaccharide flippase family protein n=1 Tax=Qipengyuania vulgaris TaxID=291985 RepID=A0A844XSI7_9SPHN|nr:lipopolysaccharide biosynthesis protein [Qipengyuania vulgaris]MXO48590.1 hypothetical protein [Qipengyuania vulgaris]
MFVQRILGRHRKLLSSIMVSGAIKGFGALFTFLSFVAVARATSVQEFGRFSIAFSLATILSFFLLGGQHRIVLKYFPKYLTINDEGASARFALKLASRNLMKFIAAGALFSVITTLVAIWLGLEFSTKLPRAALLLTLCLAMLMAFAEFMSNYYRAKGSLAYGMLPRDIIWRLLICIIFGVLLFDASGLQFRANLVSSTEAISILACLLSLAIVSQVVGWIRSLRLPSGVPLERETEIRSDYRRSTAPFWGIALVWPVQSQIGVLVVGYLLGAADVGAYFSAQKLSGLLAIISVGINQAIAPKISTAIAKENFSELRHTFAISCIVGGVMSFSVFAAYAVLGDFLLGIFDPAYSKFHGVLLVLSLGHVVYNVSGPAALLLAFTGQERFVLAITTGAAILGTIAVCICTVLYGVYGTAGAVAATTLAWNLTFFYVAIRYLRSTRKISNE